VAVPKVTAVQLPAQMRPCAVTVWHWTGTGRGSGNPVRFYQDLPDIHTCQIGDVSLVARREDVVPGIGYFESIFTCGVCLSSCQHPVVAGCKQLNFNVSGEFSITRNRPTHHILIGDLFAFETQRVRLRNWCRGNADCKNRERKSV
jgi:hypothetical protein